RRCQRIASFSNLLWILSVIPIQIAVAIKLNPVTQTFGASAFYTILPIFVFLYLHFSGSCSTGTLVSILNARNQHRIDLERRRNTFQTWANYMGGVLLLVGMIWTVPVLIAWMFAGARVVQSWSLVNAIVVSLQILTYFAVFRRFNQRAADAVKQEIEA